MMKNEITNRRKLVKTSNGKRLAFWRAIIHNKPAQFRRWKQKRFSGSRHFRPTDFQAGRFFRARDFRLGRLRHRNRFRNSGLLREKGRFRVAATDPTKEGKTTSQPIRAFKKGDIRIKASAVITIRPAKFGNASRIHGRMKCAEKAMIENKIIENRIKRIA